MRRVFTYLQYVTLSLAVCGLFMVLFVLGDTDAGALATSPGKTLGVAAFAGVCALVGGMIYWVGLPALDEVERRQAKEKPTSKR